MRLGSSGAGEFGTLSVKERLESLMRHRLEMNLPLLRANRWHEAMALGVQDGTADHLRDVIDSVVDNAGAEFSTLDRAALGSAYVLTELHMLGDKGDFESSWEFLHARLDQLEFLAEARRSLPTADGLTAAGAVVSSLAGAVLSLGFPMARGTVEALAGTVAPTIAGFGRVEERVDDFELELQQDRLEREASRRKVQVVEEKVDQ